MTGGIKSVIGDAKYANNVLDVKHNLYTGSLHEAVYGEVDVAPDEDIAVAFTTSIDAPVGLFSVGASTLGTEATFQLFVGGTVSGGAGITQYPRNHNKFNTPPFALIAGGVTIDVPGSLIGVSFIFGARGENDSIEQGGYILRPGLAYYMTLTNGDVQAAIMAVDIMAGRLV